MNWAERQRAFMVAGEQVTDQPSINQANRYAGHISEELEEFEAAWDVWYYDGQENINEVVKAIDGAGDLIVVAMGFIQSLGIDPNAVMDAIQTANDSKIVDGKVYRRPDGQIGKPPGFVGPEAKILELVREAMK